MCCVTCCVNVAQCRALGHLPLVLYLPSIEAWALDTVTVSSEEVLEGQAAGAGQAGSGPTPNRNAQPSITPLKSYPASISPFRSLVPLHVPPACPASSPASRYKCCCMWCLQHRVDTDGSRVVVVSPECLWVDNETEICSPCPSGH